jgi:1-acyl-sn-glycerol-3-phosphate acyltransferase
MTGPIDVVIEFHPPMSVDTVGGRKELAAAAETIIRRGQARALAGLLDAPATAKTEESEHSEAPEMAEVPA